MTDEAPQEIIIVRRRIEGGDGHHGGAWKIAYADFVTAMMAFFLVLWILNSTSKDSQTIIARYFNPVKMEDFAKNKKGIRDQQSKEEKPGANEGEPDKSPAAGAEQGHPQQGKDSKDIHAKSLMNEETLFQNPYAALEQIAGRAPSQQTKSGGGSPGESGVTDTFRDPFRPTAGDAEDEDNDEAAAQSPAPQAAPKKGGKAESAEARAQAEKAAAQEAKAAAEQAEANVLQKAIARVARDEGADNTPQFEVKATEEGLLISLTDNEKFGMFELGSSQPNPGLVHVMDRIARKLKEQQGAVVLRGFTDSRPYRSGVSDNWRLSASRAQMAYFMLARGGLPEARVERIESYADHRPKNPEKPEAAENRRIEILLRRPAS